MPDPLWPNSGLGMKVVATRDNNRDKPDFVSYVGLPDEMLTLAKSADVIVNSVPLTPGKVSPKVHVLSVAPLLAEAIRRIHDEESVSTLFV